MIRFINPLQSRRERNHRIPWEYLREAFATWQRVALAKDSALRAADHENMFACVCFPPAPGAGMSGATRDALLRRRLWTREF